MFARFIRTFIAIIALVVPISGFAGTSVGGSGKFWIDVDYARFFGSDSLTYIEIYYAVPEQKITYEAANGRFLGGMNIYAIVMKDGKIIGEKDWTVPHAIEDTSQLSAGRNIVGLTTFALQQGEYQCEVRAYDFHNPQRADTSRFPLRIKGFSSKGISLSDVELCTSIRQIEADSENIFYKNTLEVIPNVTAVYGSSVPVLFYYVEAYNLSSLSAESYSVRILVYDSGGKEVIRHEKTKRRMSNSSVEMGTLNVHQLKGGTYTLAMILSDSSTPLSLSSSKKFFVYKPGTEGGTSAAIPSGDVAGSEFAVMQEGDLDADFAQAKYLAKDAEIRQYKGFSTIGNEKARLNAKRTFLYSFWKTRNPDPSSLGNEFRQEYLKRIQYANEKFGGAYKQGWKTERGRVYLIYGSPDEIERFPSSFDNVPYELWHYHQIQGGAMFVFVDRTGFGDWILVHSTHRNEIHDEGWQSYLKK